MYICITESFCCTPETNTTLLINYNIKQKLNNVLELVISVLQIKFCGCVQEHQVLLSLLSISVQSLGFKIPKNRKRCIYYMIALVILKSFHLLKTKEPGT